MSLYKTHVIAGFLYTTIMLFLIDCLAGMLLGSTLALGSLLGFPMVVFVVVTILIGSLIADIDIGTSHIFKTFATVDLILIILCFWQGYARLGILIALILVTVVHLRHKGPTHKFLFGLSTAFIWLFVMNFLFGVDAWILTLIWTLAFASHLIMDKIHGGR